MLPRWCGGHCTQVHQVAPEPLKTLVDNSATEAWSQSKKQRASGSSVSTGNWTSHLQLLLSRRDHQRNSQPALREWGGIRTCLLNMKMPLPSAKDRRSSLFPNTWCYFFNLKNFRHAELAFYVGNRQIVERALLCILLGKMKQRIMQCHGCLWPWNGILAVKIFFPFESQKC